MKSTEIKSEKQNIYLIIVAAGSSTRMGGLKKEYLPLEKGTVLSSAVKKFLESIPIKTIIIAIPKNGEEDAKKALFSDPEISALLKNTGLIFIEGGKTRQESVLNALNVLHQNTQNSIKETGRNKTELNEKNLVLIHDGARPFVTKKIINDTLAAAACFGGAVPALQPVDTQKETDESGFIIRHLQRKNLAAVQTPQGFIFEPLFEAHKKASSDGCPYTDDTEIWGKYCGKVKIVEGDSVNKKITYPSDLQMIKENKMIRTGLGYDLHKLVEGRKLMLGGIEIPFEKGELGHSDGDVLLHAITDALLGACGMGDIGSFFPPEEPEWKDADSAKLLKTVWEKITGAGWQLENLDCVIAIEKPKFLPYREKVIASIAKILGVKNEQIFVKAKTGEKLGKIGRGEAVEAFATCLLSR